MNFKTGMLFAALIALSSCANEAEKAVREGLIDPDSAQFRDVKVCRGDSAVTTGEVNGKNRLGAYVGFKPFFYADHRVYYAGDDGFLRAMKRCYGQPGASEPVDTSGNSPTSGNSIAADSSPIGDWSISRETNPIDDTETVIVSLNAVEGSSSFGDAPRLVVRCQSNKTELYAIWHDYLGDDSHNVYDNWKYVTRRLGTEPSKKQRWGISTDNEATFYPTSPITMLKEMVDADRLVLQTTPYNESPVTAVFDLTGSKEAISQVAEACNWNL
ncbi:type VI secretion system-associated protein TagO [Stakelama tenebrarum]|uniref:Uncharacterized protein n=1 Tax=Stakelama tenebrarum TaxID=2711215 RepID=A0A6G6Y6I8_9SPHN|nr:type VI secretion system-associated protein TagO [Sphingosinithalassobacter tenebrarum]QIG80564.1 hypothetical protein G5C33_12770 [Sphingosinithalassobacter tenebrarum]